MLMHIAVCVKDSNFTSCIEERLHQALETIAMLSTSGLTNIEGARLQLQLADRPDNHTTEYDLITAIG
jgi:hypothetical protein